MTSTKIASLLVATLFAIPAFAQTNTPKIDQRQENQQQRIGNGINSGALTAQESVNVEKREAKIEADKVAAKSDGTVTKQERAKLHHEENVASAKIFHKKHNARTAPAAN